MKVQIYNGRYGAGLEGDFVVFLIGARINRLRKALSFLPIGRAMGRMQQELMADPSHGCLHMAAAGEHARLDRTSTASLRSRFRTEDRAPVDAY